MAYRNRPVTVKQLPPKMDRQSEQIFLREIEFSMNVDRPAVIIDCSQMSAMNMTTIHLLLCCLEHAMKRNGDVRLAEVSAQAMTNLRAAGVDPLFRVFETTERALESFDRRAAFFPPFAASALASENAA